MAIDLSCVKTEIATDDEESTFVSSNANPKVAHVEIEEMCVTQEDMNKDEFDSNASENEFQGYSDEGGECEDETDRCITPTLPAEICDPNDPTKFMLQHPMDSETQFVFIRDTNISLFICNTCDKEFSELKKLMLHMAKHVYSQVYICKICNQRLFSTTDMQSHMHAHKKERPTTCNICEKKFRYEAHLKTHTKTHYKTYPCPLCSEIFGSETQLRKHKKAKHRKNARKPKPKKEFNCAICGAGFKTASFLKRHEAIHDEDTKYDCDICNKSYRSTAGLYVHKVREHTDKTEWRYQCDVCDKRFIMRSRLLTHARLHTGEKPYNCHYCERSFRTKMLLDNHIRTHTNERPFVCKQCNKGFKQQTTLVVHMRTHSGEKPFHCDLCNKNFSQSYTYGKHYKKFHANQNKTVNKKEGSD